MNAQVIHKGTPSTALNMKISVVCFLLSTGCQPGADPTTPETSSTPTAESPSPTLPPPTLVPTPTSSPTLTPTMAPTPTAAPTPTLAPTQPLSPTPSPTDTPTPSPTPEPTPIPRPAVAVCPEGMGAVYELNGDSAAILYCIDQYEVTATGDPGSKDQYAADAKPTLSTTASLKGVIPTMGMSYDQAVISCANTPVYHSDGVLAGYKRMSTTQEWVDAADNQPEEGGTCYPYGDTFVETNCATLTVSGQQQYQSLQPTGSLAQCVSRYGIYDLHGNAWEWAVSGISLNIAGWFALAESAGVSVQMDEAGYLYSTPNNGVENKLVYSIAGTQPQVKRDSAGYLAADDSQVNPQVSGKGYLRISLSPYNLDENNFLPIQMKKVEGGDVGRSYRPLLLTLEDGNPIPDKVGVAYYTGDPRACLSMQSLQQVHFHDFDGTIGYRCVTEPVLRYLDTP